MRVLRQIDEGSFNKLKDKYDLIQCTRKEYEHLTGIKVKYPKGFLESETSYPNEDDVKEIRCIKCGCPVFFRKSIGKRRLMFLLEDLYEDDYGVIEYKDGLPVCENCGNVVVDIF